MLLSFVWFAIIYGLWSSFKKEVLGWNDNNNPYGFDEPFKYHMDE